MITHYVDLSKNELRFMPLTIFHLNPIILLMMKMTTKHFFLFVKKRVECISVP